MERPLTPLAHALVTTFGLGWCRPASGTWGSLPPVMLAAILLALGMPTTSLPFGIIMALIVGISSVSCVLFGDQAVAQFNRKDPSQVVADETAGMALILAFLPANATTTPANAAITLALAFVAFRILDIFKPFPARQLEALPAGWGILLDDLMAAVYAIMALHIAASVL